MRTLFPLALITMLSMIVVLLISVPVRIAIKNEKTILDVYDIELVSHSGHIETFKVKSSNKPVQYYYNGGGAELRTSKETISIPSGWLIKVEKSE